MKKTFRKDEKLRSRSIIERLFKRGNPEVETFYLFPFRVLYLKEKGGEEEDRAGDPGRVLQTELDSLANQKNVPTPPLPHSITPPRPHAPTYKQNRVLFSVSKRNFKRAVDRNLIRRRCREAYRLHKHLLAGEVDSVVTGHRTTSIAFLYLAKEISTYDVIEKSMVRILQKMAEKGC